MKDLQFIKADIPFRAEFSYDLPAPQFRKKFAMKPFKKAVVYVAGLGIGNFWLNGRKFSDLFISAVSDYRKTVWYHRYDVTEFLREGENVLAIWCGNGFYNENFDSAWGHNKAAWRDFPKCAVLLEADGKPVLSSDETFKVKPYTAVTFNQYRSGEYFDAGLWEENWLQSDYDDGAWQNAVLDDTPPAGRLRGTQSRECGGTVEDRAHHCGRFDEERQPYAALYAALYRLRNYKIERGTEMEKARWIWKDTLCNADEYVRFADEFETPDGKAEMDISCDSNYAVHLNGKLEAFGQYADYPHYKVYDRLALKNTVKGKNRIEILVWYYGDNFSTYTKGIAGLIYEIRRGADVLAYSGTHVRCGLARDYVQGLKKVITGQLGFSFRYDARYAGQCEYANAVEAEGITYELNPRPIKKLELREFSKAALIDEKRRIYDLGCERTGFFKIKFRAEEGALLRVSYAEHLTDGTVRRMVGVRDFSVELIGCGEQVEYMNPFRRLGARYLQAECDGAFEIEEIGLCETEYPLQVLPFHAEDELMQKIYDTSVRTLQLCMHEHYEDCPWREQSLYTMDSRNQMLCGYYAFGEFEFARASLLLMSKAQKADKLLPLCFPAGTDAPIPYFSLIYLMQMLEYAEYSKDLSLLRENYRLLEEIVGVFVDKIEANGLVPNFEGYWNFYEWSDGLDGIADGELIPKNYVKTYDLPLNCQLILALTNLEKIAKMIGKDYIYGGVADRCRKAVFENFFVEEKGLFQSYIGGGREGHYAKYSNSVAVLSGCCFGKERSVCEKIVSGNSGMTETTLAMKVFEYDALLSVDAAYGRYIKEDIRRNYGYMLQEGATSFWETVIGWHDFYEAGSLCHGWSAVPVYYLHIIK